MGFRILHITEFSEVPTTPVATDQNIPLAADTAEYFGVKPVDKVAAYDGAS